MTGINSFIITTSGSTGKPKPLEISRGQMLISARLTGKFLDLKAGEKSLIVLSTEYIAGMMMLVRGFVLDLEINIFDVSSNPLKDINDIYDFSAFVPMQLYEIIKNTPDKINLLNSMKNIIIGGGIINYNLEKELVKLKSNIYHTYGMTETITHIALRKVNGDDRKDYFTTLDDVKISQDDRGCLIINSPVTNNQNIITNDLVQILSERHFRILGRIDNVINSGGVKIQAEKVESAFDKVLVDLNLNIKFFISALNEEKYGEMLIAVFESDEFSIDLEKEIFKRLNLCLKKYEIPKKFLFTKKILETKTGKFDKINTLNKIIFTRW